MVQFKKLFNQVFNFNVLTKVTPTKGNITYEYNPFHNYRISQNMYEYEGGLYSLADLWNNFKITLKCKIEVKDEHGKDITDYDKPITKLYIISESNSVVDWEETAKIIVSAFKKERSLDRVNLEKTLKRNSSILKSWYFADKLINTTDPVLREAGELTDFITDELSFDIEHPVQMLPQYSYDGSVNLILNDGKNTPKLINSRFSTTGKSTYEVCDRKGNRDTNIYDLGSSFEIDTSLYKGTESIAKLKFLGVNYGGALKIGNYHFYFKVADADSNESDFIAESGLVSVFLGNDSYSSVSTGERDLDSHKQVQFLLSNLDSSYDYVHVYYSRYSAENNLNRAIEYKKIDKDFLINNSLISNILITGYEPTTTITAEDINLQYNVVDSAYTSAICLNRLFMANVHKPEIPYVELQDLSLRILPYLNTEVYEGNVNHNYSFESSKKGYLDPNYIYEKTGYWTNELYRFGIVYIMPDNTLSPVFNIRGGCNIKVKDGENDKLYSDIPVYSTDNKRKYISQNEENYQLIHDDSATSGTCLYENAKGVVSFTCNQDTNIVYSVKMVIPNDVKNELLKYVKGYFFVRQARIPFVLAQGITIGINKESGTPTIPTSGGIVNEIANQNLANSHVCVDVGSLTKDKVFYLSEGFLSRYTFTFKEKSSSIWGKIGKIVGAALIVAAAAVASIYTCGAASGLVGSLLVGLGVIAKGTAVTAGMIALTAAATVAAAGVAAGVVAATVGGFEELGNVVNRGFAQHRSSCYNRWNTKVPKGFYISENGDSRKLTLNYVDRVILTAGDENYVAGILCPDYELDLPHFNTIFISDEHLIESTISLGANILNDYGENYFTNEDRHFYMPYYLDVNFRDSITAKIIPLTDNLKIAIIEDLKFRARAGEAEEAFRIESVGSSFRSVESRETSVEDELTINNRKINSDIIRGSFGPFLGYYDKNSQLPAATTVNIYAAGYDSSKMESYVYQRACDNSTFYTISDRFELTPNKSMIIGVNNTSDTTHIVYRGDCYLCLFTHRVNRNFQDPSALFNDQIIEENTWRDHYNPGDQSTLDLINGGDINAIKLGTWVTFKIRSSNNLNIRTLDTSNVDEYAMTNHPRTYYPVSAMSVEGAYKTPESSVFNAGFKKLLGERYNFEVPNVPWIKNWFGTRIMYSNINVSDSFLNGFRVFKGTNYRDYTREYGEITKLISFESSLLCVFEHGVALIPVNERTVAGNGPGGTTYINTSNVLPENPRIISDVYGSQWADSVIKVPGKFGDNVQYVYGVDTVAKKIWRTNGLTLQCISDEKVLEFLNNNITLSEFELTPKLGIRNVKTFYNSFKRDVLFTFYDNTYGFEEKVWNLCWNELMQRFVTFYSWVPSVMENINNIPFSFNRNTSKWLAKLGTSHTNSSFADGITLNNVVINNTKPYIDPDKCKINYSYTTIDGDELIISLDIENSKNLIGVLSLSNRIIPSLNGIPLIEYSLERDSYGNYKMFTIKEIGLNSNLKLVKDNKLVLPNTEIITDKGVIRKAKYSGSIKFYGLYFDIKEQRDGQITYYDPYDIMSEIYYRNSAQIAHADREEDLHKFSVEKYDSIRDYFKDCVKYKYPIFKDSKGYRANLEKPINKNQIVRLLNIKAKIIYNFKNEGQSLSDDHYNIAAGYESGTSLIDAGYYQSTIAVIPKWNLGLLSTDFWKHGLAGIIDIADKIYPTYWYGEQHPFEIEFIVANEPGKHKIFNNLQIISNKAEPESFHYEIVGECYDFAKDKKNMYIRQEATKELYQYNGSDITFNHNYTELTEARRDVQTGLELDSTKLSVDRIYDKSTIFPLYYGRQDHINEIYDSYVSKDGSNEGKDYSYLSGAELILYNNLNEIRIRNNCKAVDVAEYGLNRGNMLYKEDMWDVLINPLIYFLKNEPDWSIGLLPDAKSDKVPVEINTFAIPEDIKGISLLDPVDNDRGAVIWNNPVEKEADIKDKYLKVRIRYTGKDLAVINAINTVYTISYS